MKNYRTATIKKFGRACIMYVMLTFKPVPAGYESRLALSMFLQTEYLYYDMIVITLLYVFVKKVKKKLSIVRNLTRAFYRNSTGADRVQKSQQEPNFFVLCGAALISASAHVPIYDTSNKQVHHSSLRTHFLTCSIPMVIANLTLI